MYLFTYKLIFSFLLILLFASYYFFPFFPLNQQTENIFKFGKSSSIPLPNGQVYSGNNFSSLKATFAAYTSTIVLRNTSASGIKVDTKESQAAELEHEKMKCLNSKWALIACFVRLTLHLSSFQDQSYRLIQLMVPLMTMVRTFPCFEKK